MRERPAGHLDRTWPGTGRSHRRPQAVIVPWELWRELAPVLEDALDLATARTRLEDAGTQRVGHAEVLAALEETRAGTGG